MNTNYGFGGDEVREESSWRYAIGIILATLILCALFLYRYVGPSVDEINGTVPSPTVSEQTVDFSIAGKPYKIASNYTIYPRERRGGELESMNLFALWPTLSGYAPTWRLEFIDNEPDTRRLYITLTRRTKTFSEEERIENLYLPLTVDQRGTRTPYRLNRYDFLAKRDDVPTNGYANTRLFIGQDSVGQTMALFCYREDLPTIPSPECWREYELDDDISVVYRFKRPYLAEWKEIDTRVREFVKNMQAQLESNS